MIKLEDVFGFRDYDSSFCKLIVITSSRDIPVGNTILCCSARNRFVIVHFYCMVITSMRYKPVKHIILLKTHTHMYLL